MQRLAVSLAVLSPGLISVEVRDESEAAELLEAAGWIDRDAVQHRSRGGTTGQTGGRGSSRSWTKTGSSVTLRDVFVCFTRQHTPRVETGQTRAKITEKHTVLSVV